MLVIVSSLKYFCDFLHRQCNNSIKIFLNYEHKLNECCCKKYICQLHFKSQCLVVHLNKNKNQENKYKSVFILDVEKRHLWIVHHHYHNINYRLEVAVLWGDWHHMVSEIRISLGTHLQRQVRHISTATHHPSKIPGVPCPKILIIIIH